MPLDFSRYFEDYTGNNRAKPTQYKGRGANTAARKRVDMNAMRNVANGINDGARNARAPNSWFDIYGNSAVDGGEKFKELVADVYYNRQTDLNSNWRIRRNNRGWTPSEYKQWLHDDLPNYNGMIRINGNGPRDINTDTRPNTNNNNSSSNPRTTADFNTKANRPSGWYNTSGNLKTINKNVITSPISLNTVNLKNLDNLYLDQNSGSRYLYTRGEIMKMNVNPVTRGKMAPRLLPNNIKSAVRKYVEGAATKPTRAQALKAAKMAEKK